MNTKKPRTRAEYHADSDVQQVRQSRARVRHALERYAVGRNNAIHGSDLAARTPLKPTTVRDIIAELRDDPTGPPIGNCPNGYYVIDSREELERYVAAVNEEIQTKRDRLEANIEAFKR